MDKHVTELKVQRLYTKSSFFEGAALNRNLNLLEPLLQPTLESNISANAYPQTEQELHEALATQITAKYQDNLVWCLQSQHAGLYSLEDFTEEAQKRVLQRFCMNQLYLYVCAGVNRLVAQDGFFSGIFEFRQF